MRSVAMGFLGLFMAASSCAEVRETSFLGYDSVTISNGDFELVLVPSLGGRIMRYAPVEGDNLLWVGEAATPAPDDPDAWRNYGGDKLWLAPQAVTGWPPVKELDGAPWQILFLDDLTVVLWSEEAEEFPVKATRRVRLSESGSDVEIINRITATADWGEEYSVWQVSQIPADRFGFLSSGAGFEAEIYPDYPSLKLDQISVLQGSSPTYRRLTDFSFKLGGKPGPTGIFADLQERRFSFLAEVDPEQRYPDGNWPWQIYSAQDPDAYIELELAGPLVRLEQGQSTSTRVRWRVAE